MSRPLKRSFSIRGHRTSISLEPDFWAALKEIAAAENRSLAEIVAGIDETRPKCGLSSAIRSFILNHYRERSRAASAMGVSDNLENSK